MSGVTLYGFERPTLDEVKAGLTAALLAAFPSLNTSPETPIGQFIGIIALKAAELWEVAEATYKAGDPDSASGDALDSIAALTGTRRRAATRSLVTVDVTLASGTVLPAGSAVSVAGQPSVRFRLINDFTAPSTGTFALDFEAVNAGAVVANAATLTTIATPVAGWSAATNVLDAVVGLELETDAEFRLRRASTLARQGAATLPAMAADLLDVEGVVTAQVFENVTDAVDSDGRPPRSIEFLIYDGSSDGSVADADDIRAAIFKTKAAGMSTYGTVAGTYNDPAGDGHIVYFSRPTGVPVYVRLDVTASTAEGWSSTSSDALKASIVNWARTSLSVGEDVSIARVSAQGFSVAGVTDVTLARIGLTDPASGSVNLVMTSRQLAAFDTSRIIINATVT
jgi:uncharacterized phage protein gp47/JayE